MPVLWSPTWTTPPTFSIRRSYASIFVLGWHNATIVQWGRYTILQEIPFGGFRFHYKFTENFWNWSSNSYLFQDIFEDIYVTFPGSSVPVGADPSTVRFGETDPIFRRGIINDMAGVDRKYYFFPLPPGPDDYWALPRTPLPTLPMITSP